MSHIFASAGNTGYASIWDLKAKREVLQLTYSGANLSVVEWHPTQSTKLVTASDTDSSPVILTWDLRNASTPEQELKGHRKGVLSLDWCQQDPEFLLSSGKDDATFLWNPIKGYKLCEYPSLPNWVHEAKFAPALPDVIARASYDKRIIIDTLQDTTTPDKVQVKSSDEKDFWNTLSTTDTQVPVVSVSQAPAWLKRPTSVNFGFGGKIVAVSKTGDSTSSINISKIVQKDSSIEEYATRLSTAIQTNDFKALVEDKDESHDWDMIKKVLKNGHLSLLKDQLPTPPPSEDDGSKEDDLDADVNDDDFFSQLADAKANGAVEDTSKKSAAVEYLPKGNFKLFDAANDFENDAIKSLLAGEKEKSLDLCISNDKILEALVLSLNGTDSMKKKAQNAYFSKYASGTSLARILYSASNDNLADIVENADVESWKEIASSVLALNSGKPSFAENITKLGDRILASSVSDSRNNAIACYIAGGALDKVTDIWISELPELESYFTKKEGSSTKTPYEARFKALGEVVEKIISCVSSIKEIDDSKLTVSGATFKEFADGLVNNGYYELAYKLLGKIPESVPGVKLEKERISKAFIVKTTARPAATSRTKATSRNQTTTRASYSATPVAKQSISSYPVPIAHAPAGPMFSTSPVANHAIPTAGGRKSVTNPYSIPQASTIPVNQANPFQAQQSAAAAARMSPVNSHASLSNRGSVSRPANPYAPRTAVDSMRQSPLPPSASLAPGYPANNFGSQSPKPPSFKREQGGWNDLPSALSSKPAKRTGQPTVPSAYQHTQKQDGYRSRTVSQPPAMPAPPRSVSRASANGNFAQAPPMPQPPALTSHKSSNKYEPTKPPSTPSTPSQSQLLILTFHKLQ
ncbi:unnamed protein product [Ambrosiozyma monospora]|uniref:Protein transport protein SEC31 n=1 Tax=Ambrosiozyma monospora TaxID=43982 RepID=A0A9W6YZ75_AMBMO|nr:unnamed protein product [Ambrosiozyma monospora]